MSLQSRKAQYIIGGSQTASHSRVIRHSLIVHDAEVMCTSQLESLLSRLADQLVYVVLAAARARGCSTRQVPKVRLL
jgi:hypothetical protein